MLLLPLGVIAGILTTTAGLGGGLLLILALSAWQGPHAALAITTPALLLGNTHRLFLLRREVAGRPAAWLIAGALPGGLVGGLLAARLPAEVLSWTIASMTALAFARELLPRGPALPLWGLAPVGAVVGVLAGSAGGAGLLVAPALLAVGLRGDRYVATCALVAVALHSARVVAYSAGGLVDAGTLESAAWLALGIPVGNLVAVRLRPLLSERRSTQLSYGTLAVCVALSLAGVG